LPLAALGFAACELLAARLLSPANEVSLRLVVGLACLPIVSHGLSVGVTVWRLGRSAAVSAAAARGLLALMGLATFALALALGVLAFRTGDAGLALKLLAPLVSLAAVPVLAGGLALHRGLEGDDQPAGLRTIGTAVTVAAAALMVLAVVLAWPMVGSVMLVCAMNFGVLTIVAFCFRLPLFHAAALLCFTLGCLLVGHVQKDSGAGLGLLTSLPSASAGLKLAILGVACAGGGEVLVRLGRRPDALAYAVAAGLIGLAGLGLATGHGFDFPGRASLICGICAATSLAINLRWRRRWISYLGLILGCGASLWALLWLGSVRLSGASTVLAAEGLALAACALFALPDWLRPAFRRPLAHVGEGIGWLAALVGKIGRAHV